MMETVNEAECAENDADENYLFRIDVWEDNVKDNNPKEDDVKMAVPHSTRRVHDSLQGLLDSLEYFVSSCNQYGIQLGRNHPHSSPDTYATLRPLRSSVSLRLNLAEEPVLESARTRLNSVGSQQTPLERRPRFESTLTPDEFIRRELSDIRRLLLQRFLNNGRDFYQNGENGRDFYHLNQNGEIFNILEILSNVEEGELVEPPPHYPVGEWDWAECEVCFETHWLRRRICCGFPACNDCLKKYFASKVNEGIVKIECCNSDCHFFVHRDEVSARLEPAAKEKFHQFLASANQDPLSKTCPRCNHVFTVLKGSNLKNTKNFPARSRVECSECQFIWCFTCHCPWHYGFTCKQFRKGDQLLHFWAQELHHGQRNAQKCPKCKVFIQRTSGCDHMHCSRCKTDFCYRCGDQLRKLKFFGDHYSKLSIFGCKYRYKADQPIQRRFIRGSVFGGKLLVAPVVGVLGACAGVVAMVLGLFALPVYGAIKLYRRYEFKRRTTREGDGYLRNRSNSYLQDFVNRIPELNQSRIPEPNQSRLPEPNQNRQSNRQQTLNARLRPLVLEM